MRLFKPHQILKPSWKRFLIIPHAAIGFGMAYGSSADRGSFTSPVFDPIFAWAPLTVWGILFGVGAVLALHAAFTASWLSYNVSNLVTLFLSSMWFAALVNARFIEGFAVTSPAFGLWGFIIVDCFIIAVLPTLISKQY